MPVPLEIPLAQFPTPNAADRILVEVRDVLKESGREAINPGTPHENVRDYAGFVFVGQVAIDGTEQYRRFIWVNERACQDGYNASISYSQDHDDYPIFTREYLVRRDAYAKLALFSTLTGVVGVKVTAGGSGYAVAPTISFTGGGGSGAAAFAVVFREALVAIVLTNEGTGYTSAPTVVITPHASGGTGATATASIQPITAILVAQEAPRAKDDPADSLFIRVVRVWETLPGPILSGTQVDEVTGIVVHYTKQIVQAGTAGGIAVVSGVTYYTEVQPVDAAHSIKIVSWVLLAELPADVTYKEMVDMQVAADTYSVTELEALSGVQEAHGAAVAKSSGARGGVFCTITEKYLLAAGLATFLATLGSGALIARTIVSGSSSILYSGELAVTSFSADFSGHAQTFSVEVPVNDTITGNIVAMKVDRLRFGIYHVTIIAAP